MVILNLNIENVDLFSEKNENEDFMERGEEMVEDGQQPQHMFNHHTLKSQSTLKTSQ